MPRVRFFRSGSLLWVSVSRVIAAVVFGFSVIIIITALSFAYSRRKFIYLCSAKLNPKLRRFHPAASL
jgi:hypothetical protein